MKTLPNKLNLTASRVALGFVLVIVGGSFLWWVKTRPSQLLYQAHRRFGVDDQAAVVAEYRRLLRRKNLPPVEEIRLRKALGEFYVRAVAESPASSLVFVDDYSLEAPLLSLPNQRALATQKTSRSQGPDHPFLAAAKTEFDRVLELDPNEAPSHYYLGRIFWIRKLEKYALEELERSRACDPRDPRPLTYLSLIHQSRGDAGLGRELALQALAIDPQSDDARAALVSAYSNLGAYDKALEEYEKHSFAYKSIPAVKARHALDLAQQNYWPEALKEIEEAQGLDTQDGSVKLFRGQILLAQGRFDEAAGDFAQATALIPRNARPLLWQIKAYALRGDCDEAASQAQLLLISLPRWPWTHLAAAWIHLCRGDDAPALSSLDEALRLAPNFPEAILEKARILIDKGQFEDLGRTLRPLLDRRSHEAQAYTFLAQSLYLQEKYDLAEETASTAIQLNPRDPWPFIWMSLSRARKNDADGAERAMRNAASLSKFPPVQAHEALLKGMLGETEESEKLLGKALTQDPRSAAICMILGDVDQMQGRTSDATQAYLSAVDLKPYLLRAHLGLAACYRALGKNNFAEKEIDAAFRINPKDREVLSWRARIKGAPKSGVKAE
ncbi:MAG: tetratricopeptide repeat protein [Elusimicrobia bacterium]|nr:tetratricopeptide repeat protein [Candidatus Obscuribacterium magneticum]